MSKYIPQKTPSTAAKLCCCLSSQINPQGRSRATVFQPVQQSPAATGPASPAMHLPEPMAPQSRVWILGLGHLHGNWEHLIFCREPRQRGGTARSSPLMPNQPCCPVALGDYDASCPVNHIPSADGPEDAAGMLLVEMRGGSRGDGFFNKTSQGGSFSAPLLCDRRYPHQRGVHCGCPGSATTRSSVPAGSGASPPPPFPGRLRAEEKNPFFPGEKGQPGTVETAAAHGRLTLEVSQLSSWRHPWIFYFHLRVRRPKKPLQKI